MNTQLNKSKSCQHLILGGLKATGSYKKEVWILMVCTSILIQKYLQVNMKFWGGLSHD